MNRAYISLGSNIDKERNLPAAVALLRQWAHVVAVSSVYETIPMGLRDQPNFFNAAVLVQTELAPAALKQELLARVEERLHRERQEDRNAPRTIDADLALYNDEVRTYNGRALPEPDVVRFVHVALPLAELAPDLPHPETGESLRTIANRLYGKAAAANGGKPPIWPRPDILLAHED